MERAAVLRVKRKRGGPVPAEALVLACKRIRTEPGGGGEKAAVAATAGQAGVEQNFFKLVATVASEVMWSHSEGRTGRGGDGGGARTWPAGGAGFNPPRFRLKALI